MLICEFKIFHYSVNQFYQMFQSIKLCIGKTILFSVYFKYFRFHYLTRLGNFAYLAYLTSLCFPKKICILSIVHVHSESIYIIKNV